MDEKIKINAKKATKIGAVRQKARRRWQKRNAECPLCLNACAHGSQSCCDHSENDQQEPRVQQTTNEDTSIPEVSALDDLGIVIGRRRSTTTKPPAAMSTCGAHVDRTYSTEDLVESMKALRIPETLSQRMRPNAGASRADALDQSTAQPHRPNPIDISTILYYSDEEFQKHLSAELSLWPAIDSEDSDSEDSDSMIFLDVSALPPPDGFDDGSVRPVATQNLPTAPTSHSGIGRGLGATPRNTSQDLFSRPPLSLPQNENRMGPIAVLITANQNADVHPGNSAQEATAQPTNQNASTQTAIIRRVITVVPKHIVESRLLKTQLGGVSGETCRTETVSTTVTRLTKPPVLICSREDNVARWDTNTQGRATLISTAPAPLTTTSGDALSGPDTEQQATTPESSASISAAPSVSGHGQGAHKKKSAKSKRKDRKGRDNYRGRAVTNRPRGSATPTIENSSNKEAQGATPETETQPLDTSDSNIQEPAPLAANTICYDIEEIRNQIRVSNAASTPSPLGFSDGRMDFIEPERPPSPRLQGPLIIPRFIQDRPSRDSFIDFRHALPCKSKCVQCNKLLLHHFQAWAEKARTTKDPDADPAKYEKAARRNCEVYLRVDYEREGRHIIARASKIDSDNYLAVQLPDRAERRKMDAQIASKEACTAAQAGPSNAKPSSTKKLKSSTASAKHKANSKSNKAGKRDKKMDNRQAAAPAEVKEPRQTPSTSRASTASVGFFDFRVMLPCADDCASCRDGLHHHFQAWAEYARNAQAPREDISIYREVARRNFNDYMHADNIRQRRKIVLQAMKVYAPNYLTVQVYAEDQEVPTMPRTSAAQQTTTTISNIHQ